MASTSNETQPKMPKPGTTLRQMTDSEALEWIKAKYEIAVQEKFEALERATRYENVYLALDPPDLRIDEGSDRIEEDETLYANSFLPVVAAKVDTAVVNVHNTLFDAPEYLKGDADDKMDEFVVKAKIVPHMIKTHQQTKLKYTVFKAVLSAACFDYGVTLAYWQLEPGYIPERETFIEDVPFGDTGISLPRRRIDLKMRWVPDKIDRFNLRYIPFRQCFHDPSSINGFEDSEYFFFYEWVPFSSLKERSGGPDSDKSLYYNLDQIEKDIDAGSTPGGSEEKTETGDAKYIDGDRVKVIVCLTKDHLVEKAGESIIRRQDLFDWPCQLWKWTEKDASFQGIGLIQRVEREQLDINATMSDRRDYGNIAFHPPYVVDKSILAKEGVAEVFPGKTFVKNDPNVNPANLLYAGTIPISPPTAPMQEMGLEIQVVEQVMGVSGNLQGQYAGGRRTATEAGQVGAGAATRFGGVVEKLEACALEPIYGLQFLYNQLYMTRQVRFKHYGEEGDRSVIVSPEDYKMTGAVAFTATGSRHMREDAVNTQQFLAGMDRALMAPQYNDLPAIYLKMWQLLTPRDYRNYTKDPTAGAHNIPPNTENYMMAMGHMVAVSPGNDHGGHSAAHQRYMMTPDYQLWPASYKQRMEVHLRDHQAAGMAGQVQATQAGPQAGGRSNSLAQTPGGSGRVMQGIRPPEIGVTP